MNGHQKYMVGWFIRLAIIAVIAGFFLHRHNRSDAEKERGATQHAIQPDPSSEPAGLTMRIIRIVATAQIADGELESIVIKGLRSDVVDLDEQGAIMLSVTFYRPALAKSMTKSILGRSKNSLMEDILKGGEITSDKIFELTSDPNIQENPMILAMLLGLCVEKRDIMNEVRPVFIPLRRAIIIFDEACPDLKVKKIREWI